MITQLKAGLLGVAFIAGGLTGPARADCDPAPGKKVYNKCAACHSLEPGIQQMGPSLHDIFERPAGAEAEFNYSLAMEESGLVWDGATLDAFLAAPATYLPGTSMPFAGLRSADQRAALVCFLQHNSK